MSKQNGTKQDNRRDFHSFLVEAQNDGNLENVITDFDEFNRVVFENPENWKSFHDFMLEAQDAGNLANINADIEYYNKAFDLGKLEPEAVTPAPSGGGLGRAGGGLGLASQSLSQSQSGRALDQAPRVDIKPPSGVPRPEQVGIEQEQPVISETVEQVDFDPEQAEKASDYELRVQKDAAKIRSLTSQLGDDLAFKVLSNEPITEEEKREVMQKTAGSPFFEYAEQINIDNPADALRSAFEGEGFLNDAIEQVQTEANAQRLSRLGSEGYKKMKEDAVKYHGKNAERVIRNTEALIQDSYLSDSDLVISKANSEINKILRKEEITEQDRSRVAELKKQIRSIDESANTLFDPETGQFISGNEYQKKDATQQADITAFNDDVLRLSEEARNTPMDVLMDERREAYYAMEGAKRLYEKSRVELGANPTRLSDPMSGVRSVQSLFGGEDPDTSEFAARKEDYVEAQKRFLALNRAVALNQDPAEVERGFGDIVSRFGEGLGFDKTFDDRDYVEKLTEVFKENGIELTEGQKERVRMSFGEELSQGAGATTKIGIELAVNAIIANKAKALLNIPKYVRAFQAMMGTRYGRAGRLVSKVLVNAGTNIEQGLLFEVSGGNFATGVGESLGEGAFTKMVDLITKGKGGKLLNRWSRIIGGTGGEIVGEYVGDFTSNLNELGIDNIEEVMDRTFGADMDEASRKLLLTSMLVLPLTGSVEVARAFKPKVDQAAAEYPDNESAQEAKEMIDDVIDGKAKELTKPVKEIEKGEDIIEEDVAETPAAETPTAETPTAETPAAETPAVETAEKAEPANPALADVESTAKALEGFIPDKKKFETEVAEEIGTTNKIEFVKIGNRYIDAYIKDGEALTGMPVSETTNPKLIIERLRAFYSDRELNIDDFSKEQLSEINEAISFLESLLTPKQISEAYHEAKKDGSNPELVKAVEGLLSDGEVSEKAAIEEEVEPKQETDEEVRRDDEGGGDVGATTQEEARAIEEIETVEEVERRESEIAGERRATLPVDEIEVAPEAFQFKAADDAESGTNRAERLDDSMGFVRNLAGGISVWVDKNNEVGRGAGKVYVVDGHHRMELAKRQGVKNVDVFYIDAPDVKSARAYGAMANMSIGRGTAVDAAKVYRDNAEGMKNFKPASKVGRDGAMLAKLSEGLFNMVVQGKLPVNVGVIIGENIESQDLQEQFYDVIKNRKLTNAAISVMAQDMAAAPKKTEVVANLFGETEKEVAQYAERAKFVAGVRGIIGRAKNLLKKTAKSKSFLEEFGNKIDAEKSGGASQEAAVAFVVFDRLRNTSPEVKALIDEGMQRIEAGENATKVKNDIARRVMDIAEDVFMGRGAEAKPEKVKPEPKEAESKPEKPKTEKPKAKPEAKKEQAESPALNELEEEGKRALNRPYSQIKSDAEKKREYNRISGDFPKVRELINRYIDLRKKFDNTRAELISDEMMGEFSDLKSEANKLDAISERFYDEIDNDIYNKDIPIEEVRAKYLDKFSEANRYENKINAEYDAKIAAKKAEVKGRKAEPKAEKAEPKKQPKEDVTKEVEEIAKEAGVKATNIRTLYDINRKVWGLNRIKALTTAIIQDRMIGQMAKRAGISKRKMYERIGFVKGDEATLKELSKRGKALFQIVGENANLADNVRANLQVARDMEAAGKDAKTIRIATGWEKGADGKWRYEIEPIKINESKWNQILEDEGQLQEETKNWDRLGGLLGWIGGFDKSDVLNKYPQLENIKVNIGRTPDGSSYYNPKTNTITINVFQTKDKETFASTLAHEIQHAIQDIEGFARGGSTKMMRTPNDVIEGLANNLPELTREQKREIKNEYEKNGLPRLPVLPTRFDVTSDSIDTIEDLIDKLDILIKLFPNESSYKDLQDALDLKLMEMGGKDVAFEKYKRLAGEVEARNVQSRMGMTPEQRRETTLQETEDVARDEQIVLFGKGQVPQGVMMQVDAWHGSPYQFDKFTTEAIGTGEGAQAFGWGLYFTDLESIARKYADVLSKRNLRQMYENDSMSDELFSYLESLDFFGFSNEWQALSEFYKTSEEEFRQFYDLSESEYRRLKDLSLKGLRNVYKVSLFKGKTPDQYTWLEWDKPVSNEQWNKLDKQVETEFGERAFYEFVKNNKNAFNGETIYKEFSKFIGGDKEASLFLLRAGIDGVKYPAESISRGATSDTARGFNYVVFDENAVSIEEVIKFQKDAVKARGAMMMQMDGQAVLYALTDPNVSTPLHEMAHVFEHYLTDAEKRSVLRWAGKKEWDTSVSEKFARGFEKYLAEGKSPIPSLQKIFGKFKEWLTNIYNGITGSDIDIELNQPMREIYASMLGEAAVKPKKAEVKSSKEAWGEVKDSIRDLFDTYKGGGILPNERAQAEAWFKVHQSLARYIAAKVREAIEAGLKYTKNDAIKDIRNNLQGVPNANKLTDNDISLAYTDAVAMSAGEKPRFESAQDVIDASNNTPNSVTALNEGRQSFEKQLANGLKDWIRRRWVQFNRLFPDPNYAFRQVLKKTGSLLDKTTPEKLVESYMIARSGYSAKARSFANKYFDSIYGKLSLRERQILDEFIFYTRIVEVHQARILRRAEVRELTALSQDPTISKKDREKYAERAKVLTELGLNDVQHGFIEVGGKKVPLTADMAADWLASFDSNHPEISNEIRSRAKKYFDANRELLKERYEAGLITEQEYENLESYDYMRRVFDGVTEDLFTEDVASVAGGMDALRGIKEGSADLRLARNTQALLTMNALATYKAVEQNKFMNVVADFLGSKVEPEMAGKMAEFEQRFKNENGRKPTKDEIREYRALVYPMFVHTPGTKLPDGYQLIDFKTDGKNKKLAVSNEIANTFLSDTGRTISVPKAARAILNWITLNKVLKAFAVGIAPAFAVADFFMNLHHFSFVSGPTRSFFANAIYFLSKITGIGVKSLAQKALNMNVKAVKGDTQFKKLSEDYIKHGGGFSGITNEFKTIASRSLYGKYRARKHLKFVKAVTATASFIVSISETSEMSMRVTVYDTEYKRLRSSFIKDKGRNPNDREITDMKTTAAAIAASGIDFRQGGDISKFLDMVLVFFNVAVQAARVELNNVRTKPLDTMLKFTEFGGLVFGYYAYMLLQADEDEKKGILGYSGFGDYDKRNYLIIMSPWVVKKDGKDVRPGFRLKLPTILRISNRLALEAASAYRGKQAMADPDLAKDLSSIIYQGYFPDLGLMPPTAQAAIAYNANFDLFKMKKIYTGKEMKYKPEEMYDPEKTKKLYRDIGMALGLKPQQLQASVEKVVTSNNFFWSTLIENPYYQFTGDSDDMKTLWSEYDRKANALNSIIGGIYKFPTQYNRSKALTQDKKLDELSDEMDLVFTNVEREIDALSVYFREQEMPKGSDGDITKFGLSIAEAISGKKIINQLSIIEKDSGFKMKDKEAKVLAKQRQILSSSIRKFELISLKGFPKLEKLLDSDRVGVQKESYINEFKAEFKSNKNNEMYKYLAYSFLGAEDYLGYTGDDFTLPIGDIQEVMDVIGPGEGSEDLAKRIIALQYIYNNE